MLWNWIRSQTKAAVLAGFGDALNELDGASEGGTAAAVADLRARLQALPAPEAEGPVEPNGSGKRRKTT